MNTIFIYHEWLINYMRPWITTFRFLRTTAMRDGVTKICVGVTAKQNGKILCVSTDKRRIAGTELQEGREFLSAMETLLETDKFSLNRYLGSFDPAIGTRQFNFEVEVKTDEKLTEKLTWVDIDMVEWELLPKHTFRIIKKLLEG